jgi:hypothetical protein
VVVVVANCAHEDDHHNHQQCRDPCALYEFRYQYDKSGDAGRHRTQAIQEHPDGCAAPAFPVHHHPRLRQREGQECADRVQRN